MFRQIIRSSSQNSENIKLKITIANYTDGQIVFSVLQLHSAHWIVTLYNLYRATGYIYIFLWRCVPTRAMASFFLRFLDHTQRRITVGRTSLDEWSARRRDLYMTTLNTDIHAPGGIRTHNPSMRVAVDPLLRRRGHLDRLYIYTYLFLCWTQNITSAQIRNVRRS